MDGGKAVSVGGYLKDVPRYGAAAREARANAAARAKMKMAKPRDDKRTGGPRDHLQVTHGVRSSTPSGADSD